MSKHGGKRENSGRKPMDESVAIPLRINIKAYEKIPKNKAQFIRDAIDEKLLTLPNE